MRTETLEPRPEATIDQWRMAMQDTYEAIGQMAEILHGMSVAYVKHAAQADRRFCEAMLMFSGMNILERLVDVFDNSDLFVEDRGQELLERVKVAQASIESVILIRFRDE